MSGEAFGLGSARAQVIVCLPAHEAKPILRGALVVTASCGHQVWTSPVTRQMQAESGVWTSCYACAPRGAETSFGVHPRHREEAKAHGVSDVDVDVMGELLGSLLADDDA